MKTRDLIKKNVVFFARYFKLVAVAILISVAVIAGSLVIGDSVRTSLVNRVTERLGNTETVIFAHNSYLAEDFTEHPLFESSARGLLFTNGFISHRGSLIPVMVWGVNDMDIPQGRVKINRPLMKELELQSEEALVLRLPSQGLVPSGSLFVTENYTTSLRLDFDGIAKVEEGGNLSLKNEQSLPLNVFVDRQELAEAMGITGKINLILADKNIENEDLEKSWRYSESGLSVQKKDELSEITSDRIFLQNEVIEIIQKNNPQTNKIFSYLSNSIAKGNESIPYSFVTALDSYKGEKLLQNEVILSDYSANRLKASIGDKIWISFYTSQDFKTLVTDSVQLRVKQIASLTELQTDTTLSANFPGISDVESCTQWDSDLPINMDLITTEDEHYWEEYHSTPKAILPFDAVSEKWGNTYGNATAIRVKGDTLELSKLKASMFGIQVFHPREAGIYAAKNGLDFAGLFLALGFFIILSAILLMIIPVSEMIFQRKQEVDLLKSLGYTSKRIHYLLWMESAPVVIVSAIAGVITGLIYTGLIIWLLSSIWQGATHTSGLSVYPNWITLTSAFMAGIILSLWILRRVISRNLKEKTYKLSSKASSLSIKRWLLIMSAFITIAIAVYNLFFVTSIALFSVTGIMLMLTFALWGDYTICSKGKASTTEFKQQKMMWRTLYANKKQALLSYFSLAFGVFIIFSVGLNRQGFGDSAKIEQATGGYSLWGESTIPVYHNMNTDQGKEKLNLQDLSDDSMILQCMRYSADEASCLNLNKVSTPTVLGLDMEQLFQSDLGIQKNIYEAEKVSLLKQLQTVNDNVYPALIDATVLQWSLVKNLGDTIFYTGDNGQRIAVQLVGTLPNTIFQGHILMDKAHFSAIWPSISGSEVFLAKVDENKISNTKTLFSQALHEYGVRVTTTNNRLKQFNTVTDTYLTIFMTLGVIGLLLGIMGFIIVIRKNLSIRQYEIEMYGTLGFNKQKIEELLYHENIPVPLYAIITGLISACISIGTNYANVSVGVWLNAVVLTGLFIGLTLIFIKRVVKREVIRDNQ